MSAILCVLIVFEPLPDLEITDVLCAATDCSKGLLQRCAMG